MHMKMKPKFKLELAKKMCDTNDFSSIHLEKEINDSDKSLSNINGYLSELIKNNVCVLFCELIKRIADDHKDKGLTFEMLHKNYLSYFQNSNLFCDLLSNKLGSPNIDHLKKEIVNGKTLLNKQIGQIDVEEPPSPSESTSTSTSPTDSPTPPLAETESDESVIDTSKCYARTAGSKQCSRKKQKNLDFCGSHLHNQPHGRIDHSTNPCQTKPKKRGRPPKNIPKQPSPEPEQEQITQIDANFESINGINYIVDENNMNIYKVPENFDENEGVIDMGQLKLLGKKLPNDQITWYSDNDLKFIDRLI